MVYVQWRGVNMWKWKAVTLLIVVGEMKTNVSCKYFTIYFEIKFNAVVLVFIIKYDTLHFIYLFLGTLFSTFRIFLWNKQYFLFTVHC